MGVDSTKIKIEKLIIIVPEYFGDSEVYMAGYKKQSYELTRLNLNKRIISVYTTGHKSISISVSAAMIYILLSASLMEWNPHFIYTKDLSKIL